MISRTSLLGDANSMKDNSDDDYEAAGWEIVDRPPSYAPSPANSGPSAPPAYFQSHPGTYSLSSGCKDAFFTNQSRLYPYQTATAALAFYVYCIYRCVFIDGCRSWTCSYH